MTAPDLRTCMSVVLCLSLWGGPPASAQFLDLSPMPERPELGEDSTPAIQAEVLRAEISSLRGAPSNPTNEVELVVDCIRRSLLTYRSITFRLLAEAASRPDADHLAVTGLMLAEMRNALDETLIRLTDAAPTKGDGTILEDAELARLLALLDAFSAGGSKLIDRTDVADPAQLDETLSIVLAPLLEALLEIEPRSLEDPWPAGSMNGRESSIAGGFTPESMPDATLRELANAVIERLKDRIEHPDLRQEAESDIVLIERGLQLAVLLEEADWIRSSGQTEIRDRIRTALETWTARGATADSRHAFNQFIALSHLIEVTMSLGRLSPQVDSIRHGAETIATLPLATGTDERVTSRLRRIDLATKAIQGERRYRELRRNSPPRHLLAPTNSIDRNYKRSEQEVFERLPDLVSSSMALTNPQLTGTVKRQLELMEDLSILQESTGWSELVVELVPEEEDDFNSMIGRLGDRLLQPGRREEARLALRTMKKQFDEAMQDSMSAKLRDGSPDTIAITGGRDQELLVAFDSARRALIDDWMDGAPDDGGADRFNAVASTLSRIESLMQVDQGGEDLSLNRWGGWPMPRSSGLIAASVLKSRLKLAVECLLADDHQGLGRQLAEIDDQLPMTRLAIHIDSKIGPHTSRIPLDTASKLARIACPPTRGDMLVSFREDLITLARFVWELNRARSSGDEALAEEIFSYCTELADTILHDLEGGEDTLPTLAPLRNDDVPGMNTMNGSP